MEQRLQELKKILQLSNEKDKCNICIKNETLQMVLNYIENSIPKEKIEQILKKNEHTNPYGEACLDDILELM